MMRAAVLAIAALAFAAPARGATSLGHVTENEQIALAGDTALFERHDSDGAIVLEVPLDASARAQSRLQVQSEGFNDPVLTLSGSAQRAGITVVSASEVAEPRYSGHAFSGPPAGPWPELPSSDTAFVPVAVKVDADNLFVVEASDEAERVTVREAGGVETELVSASYAGASQ